MWSAAMDVGEWLKGIGLGQYEATFRAHDIDVDVLPDVTEADLEKIGLPLGARKRLMKAIANLRPPEGAAPEPSRPPAAPSPPPRAFRPDAERRPITVMFCDLVGSTALASRLDAEDWRSLVNAYLDEASAAVTRLGGHVLKRLGDGLMALFGYPQAQENDAERAVRAALAIQRALGEMNARNAAKGAPQLSARIGLRSGPVVVEAAGEVFGDAPNVAARVQGLAEPATVLVSVNVQRQTAGLFVAEDKGAHELKGVPAPVTLYRVVRASGGGRRGAARGRSRRSSGARRSSNSCAGAGSGRAMARASSHSLSANPASASRVSWRSFARRLGRRPTPLSNCRRRSSCKIRLCIQSPNGAASASARMSLPTGASPTSRTRFGSSASTPTNMRPSSRPWWTSRCRKSAW